MKYTLLDMVQTILSSLDSDEVNSITDTTEALQIAYIVRNVFYRISSSADLPEQSGVFNLNASGASTPTLMYRPSNVNSIEWLKYNKSDAANPDPLFGYVKFLSLQDFLDRMHYLSLSDTTVDSFDLTVGGLGTLKVLYRNDKHPDFYVTFDDHTVLFDSFLEAEESHLQASKTLGHGQITQSFLITDSFIPNLDEQQFDLLLNEAKSWAHAELKQTVNQKAEQAARRGWINLQRSKHAFPYENTLPNYGRIPV